MRLKMLLVTVLVLAGMNSIFAADVIFTPPVAPRTTFNFNPGWKFFKADLTNAEQVVFDDSKWSDISAPHTYNDVDSYTALISHSGGDRRAWTGIAWYRKHFKLPAGAKDGKVFLEFEGLKQAGRFWVNGKFAGKYENGVTPVGLDLTGLVNFGDTDNVIAVKVDNSNDYKEEATGTEFEWMGRAFNPNYGGLNHDIWLHLTGKVYQTLPLYENLKTTGVYVYPSNFSIRDKTCDVNIESQVKNESGDQQSITLSAVVVDMAGKVCAKFSSDALGLGERPDGNFFRQRQTDGRKILERRNAQSLQCLFDAHGERQGRGCAKNHHRFSQSGVQRRRRHRRRLAQRQVCLAHRLRAAFERRLGGTRPGVSRLDARLQCGTDPQHARELHPLDAHFAAGAWTCPRATSLASSKSARRATRKRTCKAGNGSSAWK